MQNNTPHNHQHCIHHALETAEKVCAQKDIRLTPLRRHILELICKNHKAIGAYELLDLLREQDPKAKPVTIYRGLDFLIEAGLVHKIESLNAFIACLQAEKHHKSAILICNTCKNTYEINVSDIYEKLNILSKNERFNLQDLTLELHGLCADCTEN